MAEITLFPVLFFLMPNKVSGLFSNPWCPGLDSCWFARVDCQCSGIVRTGWQHTGSLKSGMMGILIPRNWHRKGFFS